MPSSSKRQSCPRDIRSKGRPRRSVSSQRRRHVPRRRAWSLRRPWQGRAERKQDFEEGRPLILQASDCVGRSSSEQSGASVHSVGSDGHHAFTLFAGGRLSGHPNGWRPPTPRPRRERRKGYPIARHGPRPGRPRCLWSCRQRPEAPYKDAMPTPEKRFATCMLCEAMCGLTVSVLDGKATRIEGDRDDPLSRGHICPKAVALEDVRLDPDRVREPCAARRFEGWATVGWDRALAEAAQRVAASSRDTDATRSRSTSATRWPTTGTRSSGPASSLASSGRDRASRRRAPISFLICLRRSRCSGTRLSCPCRTSTARGSSASAQTRSSRTAAS